MSKDICTVSLSFDSIRRNSKGQYKEYHACGSMRVPWRFKIHTISKAVKSMANKIDPRKTIHSLDKLVPGSCLVGLWAGLVSPCCRSRAGEHRRGYNRGFLLKVRLSLR